MKLSYTILSIIASMLLVANTGVAQDVPQDEPTVTVQNTQQDAVVIDSDAHTVVTPDASDDNLLEDLSIHII